MKRMINKALPLFLSLTLVLSLFAPYAGRTEAATAAPNVGQMVSKTVNWYESGSKQITSWWELVALWGAGVNLNDGSWTLPTWIETEDAKLTTSDYSTTYIQYIFGMLAVGKDPANAWGKRNLYEELASQQNADSGSFGSANRHMWAMLALDTGAKLGSDVGAWSSSTNKQKALDYLLSVRTSDGGFTFFGSKYDPDMTGMGLLVLGNYQSDSAVQEAITKIKQLLRSEQLSKDSFTYLGGNSNSIATVIAGLVAIGEDVQSANWTKNDTTAVHGLADYQLVDGGFKFTSAETEANGMATYQSLIALTDIQQKKSVWHRLAEYKPVSAFVQVAGDGTSIYEKKSVSVVQASRPATALDALTTALAAANISYKVVDSSYGKYVESINGLKEGKLNGWDGWVFTVNKKPIMMGAAAYELQAGDEVKFFYSRYPNLTSSTPLFVGSIDPSTVITLAGDEFTDEAETLANWSINTGDTGLAVTEIELVTEQEARISFEGTVKQGEISLTALGGSTVSKSDTSPFKLNVKHGPVDITFQVVGPLGSIYSEAAVTVAGGTNPATALDALQQALDAAGTSYKVVDSAYGKYVESIDGYQAGMYKGWDGWMYSVNGKSPNVGAAQYELQENDFVKFYYSRYPVISTASRIEKGTVDPELTVSLVGDELTVKATDKDNWNVSVGNTGLLVNEIEKLDNQTAKIKFSGTAQIGSLSIKAKPAAVVSGTESNAVSVSVPLKLDGTQASELTVDPAEKSLFIESDEQDNTSNVFTLKFAQPELPQLTATRGNTVLEIPAGTEVTSDWASGELQIPQTLSTTETGLDTKLNNALASSGKKVDAVLARIKVGASESITFNQHVTLTLKGQGTREAGFIAANGSFTPIAKYADSTDRADDVYSYNNNGDLIIKTKHFTEFLAYATVALPDNSGGGTVPIVNAITFSVEKRTIGQGDIVASQSLTLQAGDTAFTALKRALDAKGIAIEYTGSGATIYVAGIDGLREQDPAHGEGSGWMYSVNGKFPNVSAGVYELKNGDVLRFQYTKDLGKDLGAGYEPETGPKDPTDGQNPGSGTTPGTEPEEPGVGTEPVVYKDADKISAWAAAAVQKATELGFMEGTSSTAPTFEPQRELTRAEFAKLIVKLSGKSAGNASAAGFADVPANSWYAGYVAAAKQAGFISGVTATTFAPNASITREEMAAVIVRLKGLQAANSPQAAIKDRAEVSAWAKAYVNTAYEQGFMLGSNGFFNPKDAVTREMAAVVLVRLYENN
jgi:hypothetical protein